MTKQPTSQTAGGACRAKAPCGNRCCCESGVKHKLHICKEPSCYCHSKQRYEQPKGNAEHDSH